MVLHSLLLAVGMLNNPGDSTLVQPTPFVVRDTIQPSTNRFRFIADDGINAIKTVGRTYAQPFHWQKRDFMLLGGALAVSASALLIDQRVYNLALQNRTRALDRMERVGYVLGKPTVNYPLMVVIWGSGVIANNDWLRDTGIMIFASVTSSGLIQTAAKDLIGRARPGAGVGPYVIKPLNSEVDYHSFPSGHTMLSVATAWILARQVNYVPLKIVFYALPVITGASRIYVGAHWLSDVLLGSALGIACAESVLRLYPLLKAKRASRSSYTLHLVPGPTGATLIVRL